MLTEALDFKGVCALIGEKAKALSGVDLKIEGLLTELDGVQGDVADKAFESLETLRFDRNKLRSEYQDLESLQKTLKRQYFENRLIELVRVQAPEVHEAVSSLLGDPDSYHAAETEILSQQRVQSYRKLERSFVDQESMRTQKRVKAALGQEDLEWESRLEHALSKSRQYFSRQCQKIKFIRDRLTALSLQDYGHQYYRVLLRDFGKDFVDSLCEELNTSKKAA